MFLLRKYIIIPLLVLAFSTTLVACSSGIPKEALQLSGDSLELRELQTRTFDTNDEKKILVGAAGVLQDLGYSIDESETALGVIVGSKDADATDAWQVTGAVFVALLGGGATPIDESQKIRASLISKPFGESKTKLRVTIQRTVWRSDGTISTREAITDPEIYKEFFTRLSKSVFLNAQEI